MGIGELMALLAAFTVACSSVLNKYLTRRMATVALNATRTTGASTFLVILYFAAGAADELHAVNYPSLALIVAGGLITTLIGDTIFLRFLRTVDVAKTSTMAQALNTLLMVGAGALLLNEDVTLLTLLGTAFVIAGIWLLGRTGASTSDPSQSLLKPRKFLTLLFIVSLWVTGVGLMREGVREVDPFTGNAARMIVIWAFLIVALGFQQGAKLTAEVSGHRRERQMSQPNVAYHPSPTETRRSRMGSPGRGAAVRGLHPRALALNKTNLALGLLSGSLSLGLGTTFMFVALKEAGAAVTMVIFNAQLLILAPLSMIVLRERLNIRAGVGILVTIGGIIIVIL